MPSSGKKIADISEWKNVHRNIQLVEDIVNAIEIKMQYQKNEGYILKCSIILFLCSKESSTLRRCFSSKFFKLPFSWSGYNNNLIG